MTPYYRDDAVTIYHGDVRDVLQALPSESVQCVVTSPPYWGLRDYGTAQWKGGDAGCDHAELRGGVGAASAKQVTSAGASSTYQYRTVCGKCGARRIDSQLGLEPTPEEYVANMTAVFREVRRVLRGDGVCWLNLGDSYATGGMSEPSDRSTLGGGRFRGGQVVERERPSGFKPKDLVGIPWRVAFALQADGWYLRQDIIWHKPNPMPESVRDRCTKAHEYIFLLSKSARYWWDQGAMKEGRESDCRPPLPARPEKATGPNARGGHSQWETGLLDTTLTRNRRSVWTVPTQPYSGAHFATFPPDLISPMILAGCPGRTCSKCGAPWERQTERTGGPPNNRFRDGLAGDCKTAHKAGTVAGAALSRLYKEHGYPTIRTTGWAPTCGCECPAVPGVVLDPFHGAGTTAFVCRDTLRRYVGVELNAAYIDLSLDRLRKPRPKDVAADPATEPLLALMQTGRADA